MHLIGLSSKVKFSDYCLLHLLVLEIINIAKPYETFMIFKGCFSDV